MVCGCNVVVMLRKPVSQRLYRLRIGGMNPEGCVATNIDEHWSSVRMHSLDSEFKKKRKFVYIVALVRCTTNVEHLQLHVQINYRASKEKKLVKCFFLSDFKLLYILVYRFVWVNRTML